MTHNHIMMLAIEQAKKGVGKVNPNPLVGAVIVKDGEIIGKGYHEQYGMAHAEVNAIANCKVSPKGATIYVTLEPCCHHGKTPPCVDAIIESGITHVVIGVLDTNDKVAGKGVKILREHKIQVTVGVLENKCQRLNEVFFHYIKHKTPYVVMKYAMTLDGKIATTTGESKWISGELSRKKVHRDRNKLSGIMVGVETVISDNPMLNCRIDGGTNPTRIVCDTNLRTPLESNIVKTANEIKTIIATTCTDTKKHQEYLNNSVDIIVVSKKDNKVDLKELMTKLGKREIDSILLEGGGALNFSALESGIVNKVKAYIAPKIFGGIDAKSPVSGDGFEKISDCVQLKTLNICQIEDDILIESEVINNVHRNN